MCRAGAEERGGGEGWGSSGSSHLGEDGLEEIAHLELLLCPQHLLSKHPRRVIPPAGNLRLGLRYVGAALTLTRQAVRRATLR